MKTAKQLIAQLGINEAHEVHLMRQRARAAQSRDRVKVYASTPLGSIPDFFFYGSVRDNAAVDLGALIHAGNTGNTKLYVTTWCRLNHLKA